MVEFVKSKSFPNLIIPLNKYFNSEYNSVEKAEKELNDILSCPRTGEKNTTRYINGVEFTSADRKAAKEKFMTTKKVKKNRKWLQVRFYLLTTSLYFKYLFLFLRIFFWRIVHLKMNAIPRLRI